MLLGVFLVVVAIVIYMWLENRVMDRMSHGGVEMFNSYGDLWKARLLEIPARIIMLLSGFSGIVLVVKNFN